MAINNGGLNFEWLRMSDNLSDFSSSKDSYIVEIDSVPLYSQKNSGYNSTFSFRKYLKDITGLNISEKYISLTTFLSEGYKTIWNSVYENNNEAYFSLKSILNNTGGFVFNNNKNIYDCTYHIWGKSFDGSSRTTFKIAPDSYALDSIGTYEKIIGPSYSNQSSFKVLLPGTVPPCSDIPIKLNITPGKQTWISRDATGIYQDGECIYSVNKDHEIIPLSFRFIITGGGGGGSKQTSELFGDRGHGGNGAESFYGILNFNYSSDYIIYLGKGGSGAPNTKDTPGQNGEMSYIYKGQYLYSNWNSVPEDLRVLSVSGGRKADNKSFNNGDNYTSNNKVWNNKAVIEIQWIHGSKGGQSKNGADTSGFKCEWTDEYTSNKYIHNGGVGYHNVGGGGATALSSPPMATTPHEYKDGVGGGGANWDTTGWSGGDGSMQIFWRQSYNQKELFPPELESADVDSITIYDKNWNTYHISATLKIWNSTYDQVYERKDNTTSWITLYNLKPGTTYYMQFILKPAYSDSSILEATTIDLPKLKAPIWSSPTYHSLYCENTNDVEVFLNYRSSGGTWKSISLTKGNHLIDKLNKTTTYEGYFSKNNDYLNSNTTSATTLDWEKLEAPYFNSIAQRAACCQNNNPVDVTLYLKNISTNQISTYNVNTKQNLLLTLLIGTKYSGYFTASEWYSSDERSFTTIDHYKLEPPGLSTPTQHTIVCYNPNGGTATLVLVESVTKITTTYSVSYGQNTITGLKHNTRYKGKLTRNDWYDSDESDEICTLDLVRLSTPTFSNASQHSITCNNPNNVSATLHISGFGFDKTYSVSYGDNSITGLPANTSFTAYLTADDYHASYEGKFSTLDLIKLISPEYRSISQTGGLCYNDNNIAVVLHLSGGKTEDITVDSKTTASLGSLSVKTSYSGYFTTANNRYRQSSSSSFTTMDWPTLDAPIFSEETYCSVSCFNPNGNVILNLKNNATGSVSTYSVSYGPNAIDGLSETTSYSGWFSSKNSTAYNSSSISFTTAAMPQIQYAPKFSALGTSTANCTNNNSFSVTLHIPGAFPATYNINAYSTIGVKNLRQSYSYQTYFSASGYKNSGTTVLKINPPPKKKLAAPSFSGATQTSITVVHNNGVNPDLIVKNGNTQVVRKRILSSTPTLVSGLTAGTSYTAYFVLSGWENSDSVPFSTLSAPVES